MGLRPESAHRTKVKSAFGGYAWEAAIPIDSYCPALSARPGLHLRRVKYKKSQYPPPAHQTDNSIQYSIDQFFLRQTLQLNHQTSPNQYTPSP